MNAIIKKYVKERDEMLKKCDVAALEEFIRSHAQFFQEGFAEKFATASEEVKLATLHKMIVHAVKLPQDLRNESALWLVTHGYGLGIM
jgi:hypothetical protein